MAAEFPLPDVSWPPLRAFWEGAEQGELRIPSCGSCGHLEWYPQDLCSRCGHHEFTWKAMSGRATLFSWVVVDHAWLPQFAPELPFVTGLVSLEEDPAVRLATRIVEAGPAALRMDMPLIATFRALELAGSSARVVAPFFRPR